MSAELIRVECCPVCARRRVARGNTRYLAEGSYGVNTLTACRPCRLFMRGPVVGAGDYEPDMTPPPRPGAA